MTRGRVLGERQKVLRARRGNNVRGGSVIVIGGVGHVGRARDPQGALGLQVHDNVADRGSLLEALVCDNHLAVDHQVTPDGSALCCGDRPGDLVESDCVDRAYLAPASIRCRWSASSSRLRRPTTTLPFPRRLGCSKTEKQHTYHRNQNVAHFDVFHVVLLSLQVPFPKEYQRISVNISGDYCIWGRKRPYFRGAYH